MTRITFRFLPRPVLVVGASLVVFGLGAGFALAQTSNNPAPAAAPVGDTFPASLGYAVLAAVSTAGAALATVIGKLWYGLSEERKANQAAIDTVKKEAAQQLEQFRKDVEREREDDRKACLVEITALRDRLEKELADRLSDRERLLREQKDILREVMVTCGQITQAITQNTEAIKKLTASG